MGRGQADAFAADLALYGPDAPPVPLADAQAYCRRLAGSHYENFTVVSGLLPRALRQHFANVYAYCRWADDLGDEVESPERSLALLDWWEEQLRECRRGTARHPVFVALAETFREFDLPLEPWLDLLTAFRRDQSTTRYESASALLDYCRHSANPVGRIVLSLFRAATPERFVWSDSICSGLQLANFCQDVAGDFERGRIYLPRESWRKHGCDEATFERREASEPFRRMLAAEVNRAESLLWAGEPLPATLPRRAGIAVELFRQGGLSILRAVRRNRFDVWTSSPKLSRWTKLWLVSKAIWRSFARPQRAAG